MHPTVMIDNVQLQEMNSYKFLGMYLNDWHNLIMLDIFSSGIYVLRLRNQIQFCSLNIKKMAYMVQNILI